MAPPGRTPPSLGSARPGLAERGGGGAQRRVGKPSLPPRGGRAHAHGRPRRVRGPKTASVSLAQLGKLIGELESDEGRPPRPPAPPAAPAQPQPQPQREPAASERMFVSVRVRPLLPAERAAGEVPCWFVSGGRRVEASLAARPEEEGRAAAAAGPGGSEALPRTASASLAARRESLLATAYDFDRAFGPGVSNEEVYAQGASGLVTAALSGVNATVFAYGATNSGKTHTMHSVVRLGVRDAFKGLEARPGRVFLLRLSALQIHKEVVQDLLGEGEAPPNPKGLRLLDDPERGVVVDGLTEVAVESAAQCEELLARAEAQRARAATRANDASSRSHLIVRLTVESSEKRPASQGARGGSGEGRVLSSTLTFVDLAGSERAEATSAGAQRRENSLINRSLLTLGTVIRRLAEAGGSASAASAKAHVPYRDSKLTRLLQTSLAGNARAAVICALGPGVAHAEAARETLRFASRATRVRCAPAVNAVAQSRALMGQYRAEIDRLRVVSAKGSGRVRGRDGVTSGGGKGRTAGGEGGEANSPGASAVIDPAAAEASPTEPSDALVRQLAAERDDAQARLRNLTRFLLSAPTPFKTPRGGGTGTGADGGRRASRSPAVGSRARGRSSWGYAGDTPARLLAAEPGASAGAAESDATYAAAVAEAARAGAPPEAEMPALNVARELSWALGEAAVGNAEAGATASALARERSSLRAMAAQLGEEGAEAAARQLDGELRCMAALGETGAAMAVPARTPGVAERVAALEAATTERALHDTVGGADVDAVATTAVATEEKQKVARARMARLRDELSRAEGQLARTASLEVERRPPQPAEGAAAAVAGASQAGPRAAGAAEATGSLAADVEALRREVGVLRSELSRRESEARSEERAQRAVHDLDSVLHDLQLNVGRYCDDKGTAHGGRPRAESDATSASAVTEAVEGAASDAKADDESINTTDTDAVAAVGGLPAANDAPICDVTAVLASPPPPDSECDVGVSAVVDCDACVMGLASPEAPPAEAEVESESESEVLGSGDAGGMPESLDAPPSAAPLAPLNGVNAARRVVPSGVKAVTIAIDPNDSMPLRMLGTSAGAASADVAKSTTTGAASDADVGADDAPLAAAAVIDGVNAAVDVIATTPAPSAGPSAAATPAPASVSKEAALEALRPYLKDRVVLAASKITEIKRHMEAMQSRYDGLDYQKSLAVERMLAAELSVRQMGDALDAPLDEIVTLWAELREPLVRRARLYDAFALSSAGRPEVRLYRRAELNRLRYLRQCRLSKGPQSAALARNAELVFEKQREALRRRVRELPDESRAALYERFEIGERGRQRKRRLVGSTWLDSSAVRGTDKATGREIFRVDWRHIEVSTLTVLQIAGIALGADSSDLLLCPMAPEGVGAPTTPAGVARAQHTPLRRQQGGAGPQRDRTPLPMRTL